MTDISDIASRTIQEIHELWQIDPEGAQWIGEPSLEAMRDERYGFDWWPGDFKVAVRIYGPHPEIDEPTCRINIRTDFISGVDVGDVEFLSNLNKVNATLPSFAICAIPKELGQEYDIDLKASDVWLESVGYVHQGIIDWFPKYFGALALLQPIEAQFRVKAVAQLLGGRPECLNEPRPKSDETLDDMLGIEEETFIPQGEGESRWIGTGEFDQIIEKWGRGEFTYGHSNEMGLTLEVSFGEHSSILQLFADQEHPRLGSGLLFFLRLPYAYTYDEAIERAAHLNFQEARLWSKIRMPFLGNWTAVEGQEDTFWLAYTSFIPNLIYQGGLAENVLLWGMGRARWVREMIEPDAVDMPMPEILMKRLRED